MDRDTKIDPIELELFRNLFEAAAEEMGITLQRVAFSANIKERRDFSCALFDAAGELLAQAAHIPVHLGSMPASVAAVRERLGDLNAGDVAIVNDPFAGGTHLPDITIVTPVFHDGQLFGYAANRAHHADVGGDSPGSMTLSTHIDQEGVRIEPTLLYRKGVRNEAMLQGFLSKVRTPVERLGDLDAQIAANNVGAQSLLRMVKGRGPETVVRYGKALLDYAQAFMARTLSAIAAGEWAFQDVMDDDGHGGGPVLIHANIKTGGGRVVVDLRGSGDQAAGCINCPQAVTRSAVYYCFACVMNAMNSAGGDAGGPPLNGGCFRDIQVITRPGSVVDAQYPAAVVAGNTETSQRVVDVILGALAKALPDMIPAASCGSMSSVALGGVTASGEAWTYYETIGGGSGAGPGYDGASAVQCHMTNTLNTPAEAIELQYPLRVRQFEALAGSGGRGRYRGGDGIIRVLEALGPCAGTVLGDRRTSRPYGLAGGEPARSGNNASDSANGKNPLPGKALFDLNTGDRLIIATPGGGGFGERINKSRN
jgi:N-methylhydantoinase B